MTLPDERYQAVIRAEEFLRELCDPKKTPRIPGGVRAKARGILRHYPSRWEMDFVAERIPSLFQQQMDELYRAVLAWEQQKNSLDRDEDSQV